MRTLSPTEGDQVVGILREGGVVASPTDTIYGLLCDATQDEAVRRIFFMKQRRSDKPIGVFVRDTATAKQYAHISPNQERFLKTVWPGPVTVLLGSRNLLAPSLGASDIIGMRVPDDVFLQHILRLLGRPIAQTSANISGMPHATSAAEIRTLFQGTDTPDLLVDAGPLPHRLPSTIIDLTKDKPIIIRNAT